MMAPTKAANNKTDATSNGSTKPLVADKNLAAQYKFLNAGDLLDQAFINGLKNGDSFRPIVDWSHTPSNPERVYMVESAFMQSVI